MHSNIIEQAGPTVSYTDIDSQVLEPGLTDIGDIEVSCIKKKYPDMFTSQEREDGVYPGVGLAEAHLDYESDAVDELSLTGRRAVSILEHYFAGIDTQIGMAIGGSLTDAYDIIESAARAEMATNGHDGGSTGESVMAMRDLTALMNIAIVSMGFVSREDSITDQSTYYLGMLDYTERSDGKIKTTYAGCYETFRYAGDETESVKDSDTEDAWYPDEYHYGGTLNVGVNPAKRVEFAFTHSNEQSAHRYNQSVRIGDRSIDAADLSVRLDKDPSSPTGFSLDIGRDPRFGDDFARPGDLVGKILAQHRSEGSHFTDRFTGISEHQIDRFIDHVGSFVKSDAEINQYLSELQSI